MTGHNWTILISHLCIDKLAVPASSVSSITRMNSSIRDLFTILYDLSPLELELLFILISKNKPVALETLAKELDRDKTTVFRSLQKMVNLRICEKETKTLKEGGWYHVYKAIDVAAFKMETEKRVKEIKESFDRLLKRFESELDKSISSAYE
ncbi:MAG: helix-turn-helix domain-containing protein [Candidatus Eiseniibacteriota bacterium]|jgi:predicted transcriptional regulator